MASVGYILSLIGGILIIIHGIILAAMAQLISPYMVGMDFMGLEQAFGGIMFLGIFGIILGILVIVGGFYIKKPGKEKVGGIIALIFSVIAILSVSGFILGAILGIIGGILGLVKKSGAPAPVPAKAAAPSPVKFK